MKQRKRFFFNLIALGMVSVFTGIFVGGGLLPRGMKGGEYAEKTMNSTQERAIFHYSDNYDHDHELMTMLTITEATPHNYFHDLAAKLVPGLYASKGALASVRPANEVWITTREFNPSEMTIPVGTTVTWINKDYEDHTVTADNGLFDGSPAPGGGTFSYTFTVAGTYSYFCSPHSQMVGVMVVK